MKALRGFMIVLGAVAASLFGLAALALVLLLTTSAGAQYALLVAAERVPGELSFGGVDGSMLSGLELDGARYRSEAFDLELETLTIEPSWGGLLDRRLVLDRVEARIGALVLHQPAQEPSSEPAGGGRAAAGRPPLTHAVSGRRLARAEGRLACLGRPPSFPTLSPSGGSTSRMSGSKASAAPSGFGASPEACRGRSFGPKRSRSMPRTSRSRRRSTPASRLSG